MSYQAVREGSVNESRFSRKTAKILCFCLLLYALLFHYLTLHAPIQIFPVGAHAPISSAEVIGSDSRSPVDLITEGWQPQLLPDDWHHSQRDQQQYWYRLQTALNPGSADVWAIYLPSVTHNAAVYINGVWVGQGGSFNEPVSRHHNNPLLFDFSAALLQEGANDILIRVKASHPSQGLLGQIYMAPFDQLSAVYQWKHFLRVDFIQWITLAMYFMGVIVFVFWLARPQDKIYGIFSFQLFIWASHNLNLFVFDIPVSARLWEAMTMSTLGWTVILMIFFNHRYVGERNPWIERLALILGVFGLGIYALPDIGSILQIGYTLWDGFLIFFGSYAVIHLLRVFWLRREVDTYLMLLVGIPILIFGLHDILVVNHFRDAREGLIIQYSVIPAILLFSWFLIRRFVQSINQAERLAATLELRVIEKEKEIVEQYKQLGELEQQKVLAEERERIMRDMHDGIGGQLVTVVASLQAHQGEVFSQVRDRVQQSLTDLRFVIDSLDPVLNDITTLLGMMRSRLVQQLEPAGIELEWDVNELPELADMSPQRSLHIMRIVQEAVTNVIKHANSPKVTLSTGVEDGERRNIYINVTDYGDGANVTGGRQGRGVDNMKYRAEQIGGELRFSSSLQGTTVSLILSY